MAAHSFWSRSGEAESPFLDRELFSQTPPRRSSTRARLLWWRRVHSPARSTNVEADFGEELDEREALDEFEDAGELEAERLWEEVEEEQETTS